MNEVDLNASINKDLQLELPDDLSKEELHGQLSAYINELIKNDFQKLISYLYRIDVNEEKLKLLLRDHPQEDAGNIISALIIQRQQQKLETREKFRNSNASGVPGEDLL